MRAPTKQVPRNSSYVFGTDKYAAALQGLENVFLPLQNLDGLVWPHFHQIPQQDEPVVHQDLFGFFLILVIAGEGLRASDGQLAFADRLALFIYSIRVGIAVRGINDLELSQLLDAPNRICRVLFQRVRHEIYAPSLRGPVALRKNHTVDNLDRIVDLARDRSGA